MRRSRVTRTWLLLGLLATTSCSTTATFLTRSRGNAEARIIGGDRQRLLLQLESGAELVVDRTDVVDIDHPGNVVALLGGIVTFSGVTNLGVTAVSCRSALSSRSERTCATVSRNTEARWRQGSDSTTVRGAWAPSATVRVNEPPFGPTVSPSFGHASASSFFAKAAYVCSLSLKASPTALTMLPV